MTMMRRSGVISKELPVGMAVLVAMAAFTTLVAGEQRQPPCAGMLTKTQIRGSGPSPCVNHPDNHSSENSDLAISDMKMTDLASSTVDGADGLTVGAANLLPARRKLAGGGAGIGVGSGILLIIIIVAIVWCCCTGRCCCGRCCGPSQSQSQSQSQTSANNQTVNAPVTVNNHMPEQKPTVQYVVHSYGPAGHIIPAVPTPGVGDLQMGGSYVVATGNAAGNAGFAQAQVGGGERPQVGHHNLQTVAAGAGGWTGSPAPGFPAYAVHPAHHAPRVQHVQHYPAHARPAPAKQRPAQPPQAQYPSSSSNYPSHYKKPQAAFPSSNYPPNQP